MSTIKSKGNSLCSTLCSTLCNTLHPYKPTKEHPFTVALSGGIDSTALLYLLAGQYQPEALRILYVNHRLRPDAELTAEIALIKQHGKGLGVPVHIVTLGPGVIRAACKQHGWSLEESARNIRHRLFQRHLTKHGGYMLLAHTLDDNIETLVQRFFQGSGLKGLCGIAFQRQRLLRPLLSVPKSSLRAYLEEQHITWSEDSTNSGNDHMRNRIRHVLIPAIEQVFPGFRKALLSGRHKMEHAVSALYEAYQPLALSVSGDNDQLSQKPLRVGVNLAEFAALHPWYRFAVLCDMWNHPKSIGQGKLSYATVLPLLHKPLSERGALFSGHKGCFRWEKGWLFLQEQVAHSLKKGYFSIIHGTKTALFQDYVLSIQRGVPQEGALWFPPRVLEQQLVVRSYQDGDTILLKEGRKLIKELFNQWSVPTDMRWCIPLIADSTGIIGVMGKAFGFTDRVAKDMFYKGQHAVIPVVRKE